MAIAFLFPVFYCILVFVVIADFVYFIIKGGNIALARMPVTRYIILIFTTSILLFLDSGNTNDCCGGWTFFSPAHRLTVYTVMCLCLAAYIYCLHRVKQASPIVEVVVNCLLL